MHPFPVVLKRVVSSLFCPFSHITQNRSEARYGAVNGSRENFAVEIDILWHRWLWGPEKDLPRKPPREFDSRKERVLDFEKTSSPFPWANIQAESSVSPFGMRDRFPAKTVPTCQAKVYPRPNEFSSHPSPILSERIGEGWEPSPILSDHFPQTTRERQPLGHFFLRASFPLFSRNLA